jgi:hypothetical protein
MSVSVICYILIVGLVTAVRRAKFAYDCACERRGSDETSVPVLRAIPYLIVGIDWADDVNYAAYELDERGLRFDVIGTRRKAFYRTLRLVPLLIQICIRESVSRWGRTLQRVTRR